MKIKLLGLMTILLLSFAGKAQNNLDFETNTLSNWLCYIDTSSIGNPSSITYNTKPFSGINTSVQNLYNSSNVKTVTGPFAKFIYPTSASQPVDKYGKFPVVCNLPGAGAHSCRIGFDTSISQIQGMVYKVRIPANANKYNLVFYYATVLEDPGTTHQCWEMPFFNVNVYDSVNPAINFANLELKISRCNTPFVPNLNISIKPSVNYDTVYFSDWKPANMIIKNMAGKTLIIRVTSSGCSPGFAT